MRNHLRSANLVVGLAVGMLAGCGESATEEPAAFVADGSARPIRGDQQAAGRADSQVEQAAFVPEPTVPPVLLTDGHKALCRVHVGDTLPPITLPQVSGRQTNLADLYGSAASVVVFWKSDRHMAREELADLVPDVVETFGSQGVAVIGVAVQESSRGVRSAMQKAGAKFPSLIDADGGAFAKVGAEKLPWTVVLDKTGKVVWFDIEYSHATRRELKQALVATVK